MMSWMNWPDWTSGWSDGAMLWYASVHLLWYAFVIALAVAIAVVIMKRANGSAESVPALDILKRRYARGEISRDDFERMQRDIIA